MIISLFIAVFLCFAFVAIGSLIQRVTGEVHNHALKVEVTRLTGVAISFGIAAILFQLNSPPLVLTITFGCLAALGLPFLITQAAGKHRSVGIISGLRTRAFPIFATMVYAFLVQGSLGNVWTFRTGPDSFGWGASALAICRGDTLSSLTQRVVTQLNGTDLIKSFARPVGTNETSIAQIPSFTDQVAAEFLIGAHRTGLISLLGDFCYATGEAFFAHWFTGLLLVSVFSTASILRIVAIHHGVNQIAAGFIALAAVISIGPLSVTLEGGYGQLVTLPFFVLVVATLQMKRFDDWVFQYASALLVIAAMSSYLDVLYLAAPMVVGIYLLGLTTRQYDALTLNGKTLGLAVGVLVLSWPMFGELFRLSSSAANNPRLGGWHQGRIFLPDNVVGIFSSLPMGNYQITPRTLVDAGIDVLLSLAVIAVTVASAKRQRILGIFLFAGYAYLNWTVYFDVDSPNNYRIWKYSAYAAVMFSFILISVAIHRKNQKPDNLSKRQSTIRKTLNVSLALLVATSLTSSFQYAADWRSSSSFTASGDDLRTIRKLMADHDIVFGPNFYPTMYTLYGDLRFAALNRGGSGIGNVYRDSSDELVVLLRRGTEPTIELLNTLADGQDYTSFVRVAESSSFSAFLLKP